MDTPTHVNINPRTNFRQHMYLPDLSLDYPLRERMRWHSCHPRFARQEGRCLLQPSATHPEYSAFDREIFARKLVLPQARLHQQRRPQLHSSARRRRRHCCPGDAQSGHCFGRKERLPRFLDCSNLKELRK